MTRAGEEAARLTFARFVESEVRAAFAADDVTFAALLSRVPSVYPTELLAAIDRLRAMREIEPSLADAIRQEASTRQPQRPVGRSLLPLPHPLDFEWRFTADASRDLLNLASDLTPADGDVLLFGTPGLAVEALSLPTRRRLSFLAEDNSVTQRLIALNEATGAPLSIGFCRAGLPRASADAVLLDPPWYVDFIRPMLAAAATACRPGGVVILSLPPVGTRPSADADRESTVQFAARLGLDPLDHQPLAIAYDTPFFETNALAAAGVFAPAGWRRGDLVMFRRVRDNSRAGSLVSGRRRRWAEIPVGRMRLFVRPEGRGAGGLQGLIPLVEGDVLPSVSRRDPRRRAAQVWTSGNRIFRTDNPGLVVEAALSRNNEGKGYGHQPRLWGSVRERQAVERVGSELRVLAMLEAAEEAAVPEVAGEGVGFGRRVRPDFASRRRPSVLAELSV